MAVWSILFNIASCRISVTDMLSYCHFWHAYIMWSCVFFGTGWMTQLSCKPASHHNTHLQPWLIFFMILILGFWMCLDIWKENWSCSVWNIMFGKFSNICNSFLFSSSCDIVNAEILNTCIRNFVIVLCTASSLPEYSNAENFSGWIY